ncbi:MAG: hypothetical protein L3J56_10135, partial [Bacteroidales bacterium]|nr:hypothetical protein [Bacteroidales bacterium]
NSKIKAKVIRKFDTDTGKAIEVSKQIVAEEEATVQIDKLKVRAIVPQKLVGENKAIKEVNPSLMELTFFIIAPLLMLVLITFML